MKPNNALERFVKTRQQRAAGARNHCAPAVRWPRLARPTQRGRYASMQAKLMRIALLTLISTLAACVSTYVAPTSDTATAALSFEVNGDPVLGYAAYLLRRESLDDHACIIKSQKMAQISFGNPLVKTNNPTEIAIPANDAIGLRAMYVPANILGQTACTFDLGFTPAKDIAYKVTVDWGPRSCAVELQREESGAWRPIQAATRRILC